MTSPCRERRPNHRSRIARDQLIEGPLIQRRVEKRVILALHDQITGRICRAALATERSAKLGILGVFVSCLLILAACATPAIADHRVALVVGNGRYEHADPLPNPPTDARNMSEALTKLGFDVVYGENLDKRGLERLIGRFAGTARGADVALVYYAGHGATFDGVPYVVPVDAQFSSSEDMPYELVPVETLIGELRRAKGVRIAVLDACRDNAKETALKRTGERGGEVSRGLARVKNPEGLIIAYATQYLSTAADGDPNGDSPFTAALLANIGVPGLDVKEIFYETARNVISHTQGRQRPEISISFYDRYMLVPAPGADLLSAGPPGSSSPAPQQAMLEPPSASVVQPAPFTDCDRLVPSDADTDRPAGVKGVTDQNIDSQQAIPSCRAALATYPHEPRLMVELGRALFIEKQYDEASSLFRKAADAGYALATFNLGWMYQNGLGITKEEVDAVRLYPHAADAGDADATSSLGWMYANGFGVAKDEAEAVRLYRKAVYAGNASGLRNLGMMYANGFGVAKDDSEAVRLFREAADTGDSAAMNNLGAMYAFGRGVEKAEAEATRLYRRAANAGNTNAMLNLGAIYAAGQGVEKDEKEAARLFRKAVDAGSAEGMNVLGMMYQYGRGVVKDEEEAFRLFRKAADAGNPNAINNLGWMYAHGNGVAKDATEAVRLYRSAADAGNPNAINNLGSMYHNGHGVAKDATEAVRLYRKAADAGDDTAMCNLGWMYAHGAGVRADRSEARRWYQKSADLGNEAAKRELKKRR